ncbi:MAG: energy transducer TonB [Bacteroidota bacterium]
MYYRSFMPRAFTYFVGLLLFVMLLGCSDEEDTILGTMCLVEIDGVFQEVELDEMPEYLNGGNEAFSEDIGVDLNYPALARENGTEGTCVVHFEITKIGTVENIEVVEDPGDGIGEAASSAITTVTEGVSFAPGMLDGDPVRVKKDISIKFKIEG